MLRAESKQRMPTTSGATRAAPPPAPRKWSPAITKPATLNTKRLAAGERDDD